MYLYVEPVGFTHRPSSEGNVSTLYTTDISVGIIISGSDGKELATITILAS